MHLKSRLKQSASVMSHCLWQMFPVNGDSLISERFGAYGWPAKFERIKCDNIRQEA